MKKEITIDSSAPLQIKAGKSDIVAYVHYEGPGTGFCVTEENEGSITIYPPQQAWVELKNSNSKKTPSLKHNKGAVVTLSKEK